MVVGRRAVDVAFLVVAVIAWAAAVYLLRGPVARTAVGLLLLWPIMVMYNRLSGVDVSLPRDRWVPSKRFHKRRFLRLRERVDRLLDEVRRLNRLAVDAERGFRSRDAAGKQMQAIEARMGELLDEIRESAGIEAPLGEVESASATEQSD